MTTPLSRYGWSDALAKAWADEERSGLQPARISAEHRGRFELWTADGVVHARTAGRLHNRVRRENLPAVGDWVAMSREAEAELATVEAVLPRKTVFLRRVAGERSEAQVVAANVDTVALVMSLTRDFKARRIERYLAQLEASRAKPMIVLSKADLCDDVDTKLTALRRRGVDAPIEVVTTSQEGSIERLTRYVPPGETLALVGSSGVGKSTIVNVLAGQEVMRVSRVRERDQRGRHTTTRRQLILLTDGGVLLDTPGMRAIQLWTTAARIDEAFDDIEAIAQRCRFSDCGHDTEPDCAVLAAVADGTVDAARVAHYRELAAEVLEHAGRVSEHERRSR